MSGLRRRLERAEAQVGGTGGLASYAMQALEALDRAGDGAAVQEARRALEVVIAGLRGDGTDEPIGRIEWVIVDTGLNVVLPGNGSGDRPVTVDLSKLSPETLQAIREEVASCA